MSDRDYVAIARQYEVDVIAGRILACKWVQLAMARNQRDLASQGTEAFPYVFDAAAGSAICTAAELLPHIKGEEAKIVGIDDEGRYRWATLRLEPWQCWILTTAFGWLRTSDRRRRFRTALVLVPRKNAKALALDTLIPTPRGYQRMGDLRIDDYVFGVNGHPTRVIGESLVLVGQTCYEVEFATGERIVADAGHLWRTTARVDAPGIGPGNHYGGRGPGLERVRTTAELATTQQYGSRHDRNHSVRLAQPLVLPEAILPIDPYVFGVWLGDGTSIHGTFTNSDAEIVDAVRASEGELRVAGRRGAATMYRIGRSYRNGEPAKQTFQGRLRIMGVLGQKHIPLLYLRASHVQRTALLQGLMDTDGTASKAGQLTLMVTNQRLATDAVELIASLGFKPTMRIHPAKLYGRIVGTCYSIQFWAFDHTPVFRLKRKLARQLSSTVRRVAHRSRTRQIVAVRPVDSVPVKCISVESADQQFLVGRTFLPTHNSTTSAAVALYMLTADGESGAECVSAATTRDQAKIVAEVAQEMARRTPDFQDYFGVHIGAKTSRRLEVPATASRMEPLSADAHSLDGLNIHLAVVDELHAHRTRHVWDVLETATGARTQPLIWAISTAGTDIGGICYEQLAYLHKILDGALADETYFGINYTIDEGDRWDDEASFRKANPNYGVSVKPDDLARKALKARHSPAATNNFLTKHLNVWVRAESTWMPMADLIACGDPTLQIEDFRGVPCWIGVDLAETRDIAAAVALFKPTPTEYVAFGRYYLPQAAIDTSPVAQYSGWVRTGHLIATPGNVADYARIQADIREWCQLLNVREVDFDRALAQQMGQQLQALVGAKIPVITVEQNVATMNPAMQTAERLVLGRRFRHSADPVLIWMGSNIVVERNYKDEIYPRKAGGKDSPHKIDGWFALLTALSRAMLDEGPKVSVYATRGAFVARADEGVPN